MTKILKISLAVTISFFITNNFASVKTTHCPTKQSLIAGHFNQGYVTDTFWFATYAPHYEYTKGTEWNFYLGSNDTSNLFGKNERAIIKGIFLVHTLRYVGKQEQAGITFCFYKSDQDEVTRGVAMTPAVEIPNDVVRDYLT